MVHRGWLGENKYFYYRASLRPCATFSVGRSAALTGAKMKLKVIERNNNSSFPSILCFLEYSVEYGSRCRQIVRCVEVFLCSALCSCKKVNKPISCGLIFPLSEESFHGHGARTISKYSVLHIFYAKNESSFSVLTVNLIRLSNIFYRTSNLYTDNVTRGKYFNISFRGNTDLRLEPKRDFDRLFQQF